MFKNQRPAPRAEPAMNDLFLNLPLLPLRPVRRNALEHFAPFRCRLTTFLEEFDDLLHERDTLLSLGRIVENAHQPALHVVKWSLERTIVIEHVLANSPA
jgi:hypothetical protein